MVATALLLLLMTVAAYTDVRWRTVHNRTTYAGMLAAMLGSLAQTGLQQWGEWTAEQTAVQLGFVSPAACLGGWSACGGVMVVCYVMLAGGVGGGDVKLLAMIGAFLGPYLGLEAMLWTLVLGGCCALMTLVWREGAWRMVRGGVRRLSVSLRRGVPPSLDAADKKSLGVTLFLAPSALLAVLIVRFGW